MHESESETDLKMMKKGETMDSRLDKQFEFIREIDKEKKIVRQTFLSKYLDCL